MVGLADEVDRLMPSLRSPRIQIATAGEWEESIVIQLDGRSRPAPSLPGGRKEIGVEVVFSLPGGGPAFVGGRYRSGSEASPETRLRALIERALATPPRSLHEASALVVGVEPFEADLARVDLGVFNAWNRIGPVSLWRSGSLWHSPRLTRSIDELVKRTDLAQLRLPIMVEGVVDLPFEHWIGVSVASWSRLKGGYVRDDRMISELVGLFSTFIGCR